jgi:hypothetical protein
MHSAYKHLDSKLRIAELSVGQWLVVALGVGLGIVWGYYVSPFGPTLTLTSAVYIAALPSAAALFSTLTEFDLVLTVRSALWWRRLEGQFVAGPGRSARGYTVLEDPHAGGNHGPPSDGDELEELDLMSLWEAS